MRVRRIAPMPADAGHDARMAFFASRGTELRAPRLATTRERSLAERAGWRLTNLECWQLHLFAAG
jgi:hypothetical protein